MKRIARQKMKKPHEIKLYLRERAAKKAALEKKLRRKISDAEYAAWLINAVLK